MRTLDLLPPDRSFTWQQWRRLGGTREQLRDLVADSFVLRLFKGLYVVAGLPLTVELRAQTLSAVMPPNAFATDETAAWLYGVDVFRGFDDDGLPRLTFFQPGAHERLRNGSVLSGSRQVPASDLRLVHGVAATTPLRTALDLARLRSADRAIGALDGLMRLGEFGRGELEHELVRFKGYRGVVQARALVPLADPRSESPAESKLRYLWIVSSVKPKPVPQVRVENPFGWRDWRLDLAVEELKFAVEYDGERFHSTAEQREHDRRRREYLESQGWIIVVLTRADVYAPGADPMRKIAEGLRRARRRLSIPDDEWRWPA
ncbi:MAG TPA: DUF559 domain-containing protein [Nocardioidaceae bacterium]|nr:DUF559 domain-containing protein [Nocardioidaceae bacterium]